MALRAYLSAGSPWVVTTHSAIISSYNDAEWMVLTTGPTSKMSGEASREGLQVSPASFSFKELNYGVWDPRDLVVWSTALCSHACILQQHLSPPHMLAPSRKHWLDLWEVRRKLQVAVTWGPCLMTYNSHLMIGTRIARRASLSSMVMWHWTLGSHCSYSGLNYHN